MTTHRPTIQRPSVDQYFQRVPQPAAPFISALESLLIAPWYQIVRAFSGTEPVEAARLALQGENGAAEATRYDAGYYSPTPRYATLPGLMQGATVDADWSTLHAVSGSGASRRTYTLNSPEGETAVLSRAAGVVLGEPGSFFGTPGEGQRTVQFPGVDFNVLLAGYTLPGTGATTVLPNLLSDDYFFIEMDGYSGRRALVLGIDPSSSDTLVVQDDIFVDAMTAGATLVRNKAHYRWHASGRNAQRPFAGHTLSEPGDALCTTTTGTTRFYNFDLLNTWEVVFALAGGAEDDPSVAIAYAEATNAGTITVTFGTTASAFAAAKNTVEAINDLISAAFWDFSPVGEVPCQFYPEAGSFANATPDDDGGTPDGTITAVAVATRWTGTVQAKSVGMTANAYRVTLQDGAVAAPDVEWVGGTHWIINLGTTPALNTVETINDLLAAAGGLVEIDSPSPATDLVDRFSLGRGLDGGGYTVNVWDPNDQTMYLSGGLGAGGVAFSGGLLPNFSATSPNLVSAQLYAEYRALRVDRSAAASMLTTGNRPNIVSVTPETYEDIVGEIGVDNPMGLACARYFAAADGRRAYLLGISAVSETYPWGTEDAVDLALSLAGRRRVVHLYVFNDARFVPATAKAWAEALGGTSTVPLRGRPQRIYIPTKNFDFGPDLPVSAGSEADNVGTTVLLDTDVSADEVLNPAYLKTPFDSAFTYRYVLRFSSDAANLNGDYTLQDGSLGYTVLAKNVGGSPFQIEVGAAPPGGPYGSYQILQVGESLYNGSVYNSAAGTEALAAFHAFSSHPRVIKHHVDECTALLDGEYVQIDGVYAMAEFAGIVASNPPHQPVSTIRYPGLRSVRGTSDVYEEGELEILMGAGLTMPEQDGDIESSPVTVLRDLSSDTSTRVSRRRSAGVAEDKLTLELDAIIRPVLGPNLVHPQLLDRVAMNINAHLQRKMNPGGGREFKTLRLLTLMPITDEVRAEFNIDDSGIFVEVEYSHLDEAVKSILRHIVNP